MKKLICIAIFFILASPVYADWQSTLEANFDFVSTFDDLDDWYGSVRGGNVYNSAYMPVKTVDGSPSIWGAYSSYDTGPQQNWIDDHGSDYVWQGSGKSLRMRYGQPLGTGPGRMAAYVGSGTSTSGYDTIYIFYMKKYHPGFFVHRDPPDEDKYIYCPVHKHIVISPGFSDVGTMGNPGAEHESICNVEQYRREYGVNFLIMNVIGTSSATGLMFIDENAPAKLGTTPETTCYEKYSYTTDFDNRPYSTIDFSSEYEAGKWIGVEIVINRGTVDTADASSTVYFYDESGTVISSETKTGWQMLTHFDHKINKVELGGNRFNATMTDTCSTENRWYVDDFIVDGQRIGPTYFNLLNQQSQPSGTKRAKIGSKSISFGGKKLSF